MRTEVELSRAYLLINHGPTVLISAAHEARRNVMAAAWNMALDFSPPKVAVVIDKSTYTRELLEASGEFVINVPCVAQAQLTTDIGNSTGREKDKFEALGIQAEAASRVRAPLVQGCIAWLECKLINEPDMARKYDLFLGEVVAAWADSRVYRDKRWLYNDDKNSELAPLRSIHHIASGNYFTTGALIKTRSS